MMDNDIKKVLNERVENTNIPDLLPSIKREVAERKNNMKKISIRPRIIIAAAITTVLLASASIAGGKIAFTRSSSSRLNDITDFKQLENISDKTGYDVKVTEKLGDYTFEVANVGEGENVDESGNVIKKYKNFSAFYNTTKDGAILSLHINPTNEREHTGEAIDYKGTTLYYSSNIYMSVPPDYEPTAEEKELEKKGELQIGYGSDKLYKKVCQSIIWEDNGLTYDLLDMGEEVDKNELIDMAKSVIDAE